MARTHRTAVVTATSHNLHLLAQLLHGTTPDAPRFAAIKLLTALAKHKVCCAVHVVNLGLIENAVVVVDVDSDPTQYLAFPIFGEPLTKGPLTKGPFTNPTPRTLWSARRW